MMSRRLTIIALLALLTVACKVGKNYRGATIDVPLAFSQRELSPGIEKIKVDTIVVSDTIGIQWWTIYNDPILDSLIQRALNHNRSAQIAAESIVQARISLQIQKADFGPQLNIGGSGEYSTLLINQIIDANTLFIGQSSAFWEIDIWGRLQRLSEAARNEWLASEAGYRAMMMSLISDVTTTYFLLLETRENLAIAQRNLALRDSMLGIIEQRFARGIVPKIDVNQAQIQLAIAATAVPQNRRREIQLQNTLCVLIGSNPTHIPTPIPLAAQNSQLGIEIYQPREIVKRRPDIVAAEYQLIAQNARVGAAQANRLPTLSLFGNIGFVGSTAPDFSVQNPLYQFGLQLGGPLFYWGKLKRATWIEESRKLQAQYAYENAVLYAVKEIEDVLIELKTLQEEIEIAEYRRDAALNAQLLSGSRYSQGVTSYLEYLESQRQAFDAELILTRTRQQFLSAKMRLYKVLGGGKLIK
ncbi:MAG: TolC family protein [Cyclobacteriaceae bacterium]|nr:TolC family protein [Cyclobacteriaceae bacterium]